MGVHKLLQSGALSYEAAVLAHQCQAQERQQTSLHDAVVSVSKRNHDLFEELCREEQVYQEQLAALTYLRDRIDQLQHTVSIYMQLNIEAFVLHLSLRVFRMLLCLRYRARRSSTSIAEQLPPLWRISKILCTLQ